MCSQEWSLDWVDWKSETAEHSTWPLHAAPLQHGRLLLILDSGLRSISLLSDLALKVTSATQMPEEETWPPSLLQLSLEKYIYIISPSPSGNLFHLEIILYRSLRLIYCLRQIIYLTSHLLLNIPFVSSLLLL